MSSVLDELCVNTIRSLSMDMVEAANSGHPGLPMGAAAMGYAIWERHLRHNPDDPEWINRDRFVLSAGHGCALLYSLLHLTGYELSLDDLKNFRQWGSRTPGHPELHLTPGVEATTGPLGQGVGNIVGMAVAREKLAAIFNTDDYAVIDYRVFGICSDGDLMEGVASEAASLAGHLKLGCITLLYDDNHITIDGRTDIAFSEDVNARFAAYGWHVLDANGLNPEDVAEKLQQGVDESNRPTLIRCRTTIGYGAPKKADTPGVHGSPLGEEELKAAKTKLGLDPAKRFDVPKEVFKHMRLAKQRGAEAQEAWEAQLEKLAEADSKFVERWEAFWSGNPPEGLGEKLPTWKIGDKAVATRSASGEAMQVLAEHLPGMIGGSADLASSNKTALKNGGDFSATDRSGQNVRFGIREHAMGAMLNGIAASGPFIAFGSTFLTFLDYMKPSVRIAALSGLPVIYVFSHDSIGLGEDGPTHQPIEHLCHLRATPDLWVFRPADANETIAAWKLAIDRRDGPTVIATTRQNVPVLTDAAKATKDTAKGAYVLADCKGKPDVILLATGSEVALVNEAKKLLDESGVKARVVSVPCLELFDLQSTEYREKILPRDVKHRLAVEAGATQCWWRFVGTDGDVLGLDHFGASAPAEELFEKFGFSAQIIAERARKLVDKS